MCGELFAICRIVRVEKARWDPEPNGLNKWAQKSGYKTRDLSIMVQPLGIQTI